MASFDGKVLYTVYRIDGVPEFVTEPGRNVASQAEYCVAITIGSTTKMTPYGPSMSLAEPLEFELEGMLGGSRVLVEVMRRGDTERNLASKAHALKWFESRRTRRFSQNVIVMTLPRGIRVHLSCKWKLKGGNFRSLVYGLTTA
ncbi:hypothetical protein Poli38472_013433 [Pythium oligandrum]|uniref:Uncharacterized protein n=1 Tax=Pythium oligandrum TaxID=41045 RepID=A0A8K1FEH9_PYTOL|nr:hypothetical protein Poli38472_013433 [Pythium oligandrum]|eukprot:TMW57959.1 hypothetical protein Poli38472_013433 [Pythium oligandrum]